MKSNSERHLLLVTIIGIVFGDLTISHAAQTLWQSGRGGYHTYRIPAIVETTDDTLLAFCEGRSQGSGDAGDIDLLMRRSKDRGKTWSEQTVIWSDATNTCGNPAPVVDRTTGTIWLLINWNRGDDRESEIITGKSHDTRRVFITQSTDDGVTFSLPKEITSDVKATNWTWYATGPGTGIQIERGAHAGRLVIPCNHIEAGSKHYFSHVIFSDDHGQTWQRGGTTPKDQVNECQVAELPNGRLVLNMRNYDRTKQARQIAFSADGGLTWTDQQFDETLVEPVCQASLRGGAWLDNGDKRQLFFSNPANSKSRVNLTIRMSEDSGKTWPKLRVLHKGPSAYSDLVVMKEGVIGCLYEAGEKNPYESIVFETITTESLITK